MASLVTMGKAGYVSALLRTYFPAWLAQKQHAEAIDPYLTGQHPLPIAAAGQTRAEQAQLREIARTPYGRLIVNSCVQSMKVVGIRSPDDSEPPPIWKDFWVRNRMTARQVSFIRPAVAYGVSYSSIMPGMMGLGEGEQGVVWRTYTPKTMTAFFAEEQDEYPMIALNGIEQVDTQGKYLFFEIFDTEGVHFAIVRDWSSISADTLKVEYIETRPYDFAVPPVIAHSPQLDGDSGSHGELVPFLPILHRIDQTVYDRLLIQRQAAWKVRTAAGVKQAKGTSAQAAQVASMKAGDLLTSDDPATKFGTLDASSMAEHNAVHEADLRDLSAVTQTPPYHVMGLTSSMQPESLAAITSGYYAKIESYQDAIGESVEQAFRLAAYMDPGLTGLGDFAETRWKGFRPYSLTQVADSLGKLAQQLQVPVEMLFEQIPFFTDDDVKRAIDGKNEAAEEARAQALADSFGGEDEDGENPNRPGAGVAAGGAAAARARTAAVAASSTQNAVK